MTASRQASKAGVIINRSSMPFNPYDIYRLFSLGLLDEKSVNVLIGTSENQTTQWLLKILAKSRPIGNERLSDAQLQALIEALELCDKKCIHGLINRISQKRTFQSVVTAAIHCAFFPEQLSRLFSVLSNLTQEGLPDSVVDWFRFCSLHKFTGSDLESPFATVITPVDGVLLEIHPGILKCFEKGILSPSIIVDTAERKTRRL